jgi:hypothetical protein
MQGNTIKEEILKLRQGFHESYINEKIRQKELRMQDIKNAYSALSDQDREAYDRISNEIKTALTDTFNANPHQHFHFTSASIKISDEDKNRYPYHVIVLLSDELKEYDINVMYINGWRDTSGRTCTNLCAEVGKLADKVY